jgi:signal transduction histidine kinase
MYVVPLLSLIALWAFAAVITIGPALAAHQNGQTGAKTSVAVDPFAQALPQERQDTYMWQLSGGESAKAALTKARQTTDAALQTMEAALRSQQGDFSADTKQAYGPLLLQLGQIATIRQQVDAGAISATAAFARYDDVADQLDSFLIIDSQSFNTPVTAAEAGALDSLWSLDMTSREATLVNGAFAQGGQLTPAARTLFVAAAAERAELSQQTADLVPSSISLSLATNTQAYKQFVSLESQILNSTGSAVPVKASVWGPATGAYLAQAGAQADANAAALAGKSTSYGDSLTTEAIFAGGVGLVAVIVSVVALVWFGRRASGDLTKLNRRVRDMADERLPSVVERLSKGEDVDVQSESPVADDSTIREIHDIAESFATVQGAAVAAAVDQARLRKGISQLFLNISMRNQSLLHRQLGMLDTMERRTSEPDSLAELFRLDHLTTRMRRHAEGLIILAGSTPGRGWRDPVLALDVLRAAIAEVEDYVRVDVASDSRDMIAGNAVNDIIHLIAELVENATVFSPPHTRVEVRAERVGTGLIAEIEDRGLGLSESERTEINNRLAAPSELDLATSDQLGLYIVGQLATRHGIKVSLRESVYGGTTAIVRIPFGVIVREEDVQSAGAPDRGEPLPGFRPGPVGESAGPATMTADAAVAPGRHRLPTTATGRISGSGGTAVPVSEEERDVPGPRTMPRAPWELGRTEAQPELAAPAGPAAPAVPAVPDAARTAGQVAPGGSHLGMPIRVPQASMSPQLREKAATRPAGRSDEPDQRAPETTRDLMSMMQEGWQRGRMDDLDDPVFGASDNETDR